MPNNAQSTHVKEGGKRDAGGDRTASAGTDKAQAQIFLVFCEPPLLEYIHPWGHIF